MKSQLPKTLSEIKHDLATPLLTIKAGCKGLENTLPKLIDGYISAVSNNLIQQNVSDQQIFLLQKIVQNMTAATLKIEHELNTLPTY